MQQEVFRKVVAAVIWAVTAISAVDAVSMLTGNNPNSQIQNQALATLRFQWFGLFAILWGLVGGPLMVWYGCRQIRRWPITTVQAIAPYWSATRPLLMLAVGCLATGLVVLWLWRERNLSEGVAVVGSFYLSCGASLLASHVLVAKGKLCGAA
jgi:hypothetical protein